ncbi:hypothetical protein ACIBIZ_52120 [Nonomuraea spiralis]|uniref:hypothetical protein n=1 Tax=Nonomuraea spiralis TaxID=46182 RepID=UPI0037A329BD
MERRKVQRQLEEELGYAATRLQELRRRVSQQDTSGLATEARRLHHATGEALMRAAQLDAINLLTQLIVTDPPNGDQAATAPPSATSPAPDPGPGPTSGAPARRREGTSRKARP